MGKTVQLDIEFTKKPAVFYGGDSIAGIAHVFFSEPTTIQTIYVTFLGRAKVHYKVNKGDSSISYRSEEIYFNRLILLVGSRRGPSQEHRAGRHSYEFTHFLPPNLPSSFGGHYGYVKYLVTGVIDRGPWHTDTLVEKPITVLSHYDLNNIEYDIVHPAEGHKEVSVDCCCFIHGTVSAKFAINKRGFVPGEYIIFSAGVHNKSNTSVGPCSIQLVQIVNYFGKSEAMFSSGTSKAKENREEIVRVRRPMVLRGQKGVWKNLQLRVPPLPPSTLPNCENINIQYSLDFCVYNQWGCDLRLSTDIVIGTIPLRDSTQSWVSVTQDHLPPAYVTRPLAAPSIVAPRPLMPPAYDELPPTYEECMLSMNTIIDEQDGNSAINRVQYRPLYATYNFPVPAGVQENPPPSYTSTMGTAPITEQPTASQDPAAAPMTENPPDEADTQI